ncbi:MULTISPECIES: Holliday junction branch migration protein RuvA [unclassified Wenzhouxiangella]|uniref:Holliday junction branch migration protein RuvA n=1 Tax=unclassified Wenzhouxiangella TaxID=2613841 RepID=UPI000E32B9F2|nr:MULTISPECIES: Holliday junction branch migration protein RuvA [unclassified Wenzhouxiangella]RFF28200.1 Holliday junction branch migration protein RuvA [Wenzhouxiangella sp. 15181]RFP67932.1 Holliday junction branch migration protein RuvA [Wenzhouxiangella sp. 15190]
MIVRLSGTLVSRQPPALVIDVGGIGYEVEAPLNVFDRLPGDGEPVTILTHLVVKEDAHTLYGFLAEADRKLFRELLKVSGIGPRLALAILSGVSGDDFALMVESGDSQALTRLPGIGKKTAERLILEMRGRISDLGGETGAAGGGALSADAEAREALTALGYSSSEALKMVRAVADKDLSAEALIRNALKKKMQG